MKLWRPTWDTLLTLLGAVLLLLLSLRTFLPSRISLPLSHPGTFAIVAILCAIILCIGVLFGTIRHKEASPMVLAGLGILCLLLPLPPSTILLTISVVSFAGVALLSVLFRQHSLDIPRAPSMEDLMQNAL